MRHEFVERRQWLSDQAFLDLVGATNLIPGPNSTEMALHIGRVRAGWRGLLVAGACFILPAVAIVGAIALAYARGGKLPAVQAIFYGLKPVVIAVVAVALWGLARTAVRSGWHIVLAAIALVALVAGVHELVVLAIGGIVGAASRIRKRPQAGVASVAIVSAQAAVPIAAGTATAYTSGTLFLVFLKSGALLFGSGYVLLAFLRADLVERLRWLTEQQLLDAVAVGQFTPGPVFTTATFIGYLLAGWTGAAVATLGIFTPAFLLVAASGPFVSSLRESRLVASLLDGVTVGALALMAVVTWQLGRVAIVDVTTALLVAGSVLVLVRFRLSSTWLIAAGACAGMILGMAACGAPAR